MFVLYIWNYNYNLLFNKGGIMTFITDIFINLNYDFFDFYEWNKKDHIEHLKKIPIIKIDNKDFINIIYSNVTLLNDYLNKYERKCEKYNNKKLYNYLALTNGTSAIVISFNKKGNILKKSSLIFEDEENICIAAKNNPKEKIEYYIRKKETENYLTRFQKERKKYLLKNIKNISNNKLKYLYFDCFNKQENNINIIINKISSELKNDNIDVYNKSNNLFNLINK